MRITVDITSRTMLEAKIMVTVPIKEITEVMVETIVDLQLKFLQLQ